MERTTSGVDDATLAEESVVLHYNFKETGTELDIFKSLESQL
jgi:hypothetical protein